MGAPLPITGIGAPTVLIGGLPAARQTDFCACIAPVPVPVDPIILGSPVVIISGLPAAYMTAPTAKGGMILPPCCPTVLIGLTPKPVPVIPGAPAMPSSIQKPTADDPAELELIARSATPATYTPGSTSFSSGSGNPLCATLAVEAKEIPDARNDALLDPPMLWLGEGWATNPYPTTAFWCLSSRTAPNGRLRGRTPRAAKAGRTR